MKKTTLLIALFLLPLLGMAQTTEGEWTYVVEDGGVTITASTATGAVTIPSELAGIPVRKVRGRLIGDYGYIRYYEPFFTYDSRQTLISITIPDSVTSIESGSFSQCASLTTITIPNSVTSIGEYAFINCAALTSITIPNSVTSIGSSAFMNCAALTSITIPNSVTSIGSSAFKACISLTSVTIPNSVTSIADSAFNYCTSLTSITIPNSVTSIGDEAFSSCTSLTSITIPNSVTIIENGAFQGCTSLLSASLPPKFMADASAIGITGQVAADNLVQSLAQILATNQTFITNLAQAIVAANGNYGLATQTGVSGAITTATSTLATKTELTAAINEGKAAGIASVTASPNTWSLFTAAQIHNMAIGDLVLNREQNGSFVLNYDIEQSEDMVNWTPYQALSLPLTGLPTDKAFVRIKAK